MILEKLYPVEKENITLEDTLNYSWDQMMGNYFPKDEYIRTPEEQKIYEDSLPRGQILLRELMFDMESYYKRQEIYYKSKGDLIKILELPD